MSARKIIPAGIFVVLALALIFFASACSQRKSRVDASRVAEPPGIEAPAYEEDAGRSAEAERRAQAEREARLEAAETAAAERSRRIVDEVKAFESEPIYFEFDRSDVMEEYRPVLERKAAWLKSRPEYGVRIEGHCDDRGTAEYNVALGQKRAFSVADYLVALGVPAKRISTISYGEERPAARGQNESAWARNRRAAFRLLK